MKSTKEMIAVMQAFVDGKPVQWRYADEAFGWRRDAAGLWDWLRLDYRIAPTKPRTGQFSVEYRAEFAGLSNQIMSIETVEAVELTDEVKAALKKEGIEY